ncbi:unnamed protein product, partial [Prunus brigantina]
PSEYRIQQSPPPSDSLLFYFYILYFRLVFLGNGYVIWKHIRLQTCSWQILSLCIRVVS